MLIICEDGANLAEVGFVNGRGWLVIETLMNGEEFDCWKEVQQ